MAEMKMSLPTTLLVFLSFVSLSVQTSEPIFIPDVPIEARDPKCMEAPETGVCRGAIPMYYYDPTSGSCEKFIWGGCPGSQNKFPNKEACVRTCIPEICSMPASPGPCRANIPMWYHDAEYQMCNEFSYGGCDGNQNRFPSEEQCQAACGGLSAPCEMGSRFETVGWHTVTSNARHSEWFSYRCEGRCREMCTEDHPWGTCLAFSIERKWYKCNCHLYDRFLSEAEFESGSKGITRNRQCTFNGKGDENEDEK